jgi:hypothetical protein
VHIGEATNTNFIVWSDKKKFLLLSDGVLEKLPSQKSTPVFYSRLFLVWILAFLFPI